MKKAILKAAMTEISDDTKFIRLATITTFVHSLLFILYLIYLTFSIAALAQGSSNPMVSTFQDTLAQLRGDSSFIVIFVIICIIGIIGYALLPPVGEAAMISYLDSTSK